MTNQANPIIASRPLLDTSTSDLVMASGRLVDDPTCRSTILFLLRLKRGSSPALYNLGSRYHTIDRINTQKLREIEQMTLEALDPLIQPKKITSVVVSATTGPTPGVVQLHVDWFDQKGGQSSLIEYLSVGSRRTA